MATLIENNFCVGIHFQSLLTLNQINFLYLYLDRCIPISHEEFYQNHYIVIH